MLNSSKHVFNILNKNKSTVLSINLLAKNRFSSLHRYNRTDKCLIKQFTVNNTATVNSRSFQDDSYSNYSNIDANNIAFTSKVIMALFGLFG